MPIQTFQNIYIICTTNFCEIPNQTSQYIGVCWNAREKKWQAQLTDDKKKYYGGLFDNEKHAAMKVNLLCDNNGIKGKNTVIIIEPDKIKQVMHALSKKHEKVRCHFYIMSYNFFGGGRVQNIKNIYDACMTEKGSKKKSKNDDVA